MYKGNCTNWQANVFPTPRSGFVQQNHWSERGRATSVAEADALGRPRRSVLSLVDATCIMHS
jgi:hypothetical protein